MPARDDSSSALRSFLRGVLAHETGARATADLPRHSAELSARIAQLAAVSAHRDGEECSICLGAPKETQGAVQGILLGNDERQTEIVALRCSHRFHRGCIGRWVCYRPTCPLCKRQVFEDVG